MTRHQESVDETIDRVAAQLTMVPADASLAARIAGRIETQATNPFGWQRLSLGAAAVAAVAIIGVMVSTPRREPQPVDIARAAQPPSRAEERRAAAAPEATAVPETSPALAGGRAPSDAPAPLPEIPQIDALTPPVLLTVDTLPTNTLTITPVELAPLDLANLAVDDIDERDDPKE